MPEYFVLCRPWAIYVKEKSFFLEQGGGTQDWGKAWRLIEADSIEDASAKGRSLPLAILEEVKVERTRAFIDDKALRRLRGKSIQETHVDHAADNTITFEVVFTDGTTLRLRATFAQQLVVELLDHNPRLSSFARINKPI